ncbi:hypothetical protein ACLESD_37985 [Pyxidicoccus sp. 3LFB2]
MKSSVARAVKAPVRALKRATRKAAASGRTAARTAAPSTKAKPSTGALTLPRCTRAPPPAG